MIEKEGGGCNRVSGRFGAFAQSFVSFFCRVGDWKLMKGTTYGGAWDSWYGPSGRSGYSYSWDQVRYGPWNKSLVRTKKKVIIRYVE